MVELTSGDTNATVEDGESSGLSHQGLVYMSKKGIKMRQSTSVNHAYSVNRKLLLS